MHYVEKIPNGKLVAIDFELSNGKVSSMKITGDFFLHPEESIEIIEGTFLGVSKDISDAELLVRLNRAVQKMELIGVSVDDLVRMFKKAVKK